MLWYNFNNSEVCSEIWQPWVLFIGARNKGGVEELWEFAAASCYISEMVQTSTKVTIGH